MNNLIIKGKSSSDKNSLPLDLVSNSMDQQVGQQSNCIEGIDSISNIDYKPCPSHLSIVDEMDIF